MKNHPLVSILIPAYNQKPTYLRECISSAINQTYKNIEVIVSNNWSTDIQVEEVIAEFTAIPNFISVKPDVHLSMIDNFCFVADQAKGDYISFLSSDDLLELDAIELLVESLLKNTDTKLAFGEAEHVDAASLRHLLYARNFGLAEGNYSAKEFLEYYSIKDDSIWMIGDLIERNEYYAIGGIKSENIHTYHDSAFLFRWLNKGNSISYVNRVLGKFRVWENAHQKADGNRDKISALDTIQLHNIIFNSKYIVDVVGKEKLTALKHKHMEMLARYWSIIKIRGETNQADFNEVKSMICSIYTNSRIRFYFFCCKKPVSYLVYLIISSKDLFKKTF